MAEEDKKATKKSTKKRGRPPKKTAKTVAAESTDKKVKTAKPSAKVSAETKPKESELKPNEARFRIQPQVLVVIAMLAIAGLVLANNLMRPMKAPDEAPQALSLESAEAFSDRIVELLGEGQCETIAEETSLGFQVAISRQDWLEQCATAASVLTGSAKEVRATDSNLQDDITEFAYEIEASDNETYIVITQLVSRDGQWQLQGIDSRVK